MNDDKRKDIYNEHWPKCNVGLVSVNMFTRVFN